MRVACQGSQGDNVSFDINTDHVPNHCPTPSSTGDIDAYLLLAPGQAKADQGCHYWTFLLAARVTASAVVEAYGAAPSII